jgi:hypothetical protein
MADTSAGGPMGQAYRLAWQRPHAVPLSARMSMAQLFCAMSLLGLCALSGAQQTPSPATVAPVGTDVGRSAPLWHQLKASEQSALAPLAGAWDSQPAASRQKWVALAQRMQAMGAGERARIQQRMSTWASLPAHERAQARQQFQEAQKSSSAQDRQQHWAQFQSLPLEQRQQLAQRAQERQSPNALPIRLRPSVVNTPAAAEGSKAEAKRAQPASAALKRPLLGATTTLASQLPTPPSHHKPGQPKVAGSAEFVDSRTLLPLSGGRPGLRPATGAGQFNGVPPNGGATPVAPHSASGVGPTPAPPSAAAPSLAAPPPPSTGASSP